MPQRVQEPSSGDEQSITHVDASTSGSKRTRTTKCHATTRVILLIPRILNSNKLYPNLFNFISAELPAHSVPKTALCV